MRETKIRRLLMTVRLFMDTAPQPDQSRKARRHGFRAIFELPAQAATVNSRANQWKRQKMLVLTIRNCQTASRPMPRDYAKAIGQHMASSLMAPVRQLR